MPTRFAPSPTGPLHIGHAFAALVAEDLAKQAGGKFLLRIEDIDQSRARSHWENQIYNDLRWLGVTWSEPVMRQSDRLPRYREALQQLWDLGLLYPCHCNRKDILAAASAPQEGAPLHGPDGIIYPGTCRDLSTRTGPLPDGTLRLDMALALKHLDELSVSFEEIGPLNLALKTRWTKEEMINQVGDVVIARRDMGTSYHLSVVIDDHDQGITLVTRGEDLAEATSIHVVLQRLLGLSSCKYRHHKLVRDSAGKRLAKRDDARAIAQFRSDGLTPADIRDLVDFKPQVSSAHAPSRRIRT